MAWCRSHAELDSASNDFFASQVLVQCVGASLVRMMITASQTHEVQQRCGGGRPDEPPPHAARF